MKNASAMSAVAGFAAAAVLFGLSCFQRNATADLERPPWPPRPGQIVNWSAAEEFGLGVKVKPPRLGAKVIPPNGELVITAVPSDRWLVITQHNSLAQSLLVERLGGIDTVKHVQPNGNSPDFGGTSLGLAFRPGSELVLKNPDTGPRSLNPFASFTGYYSR